MIIILQRVLESSVVVDGEKVASSGKGLLLLAGVEKGDDEQDAALLAEKILKMRIFEDENEKMNYSVSDIGGSIVIVPNFTLLAAYRKGNRPDFTASAPPAEAKRLFEYLCSYMSDRIHTERGIFGADMKVSLLNDGPVTICMDSRVLKKERAETFTLSK